MESEERLTLERRMGHLERTLVAQEALFRRNAEILDDIRKHLNRPVNWAEWVMAGVATIGGISSIIWAVFVQPLDARVDVLAEKAVENSANIRSVGDYARESRSILDVHTANEKHVSRGGSGRN